MPGLDGMKVFVAPGAITERAAHLLRLLGAEVTVGAAEAVDAAGLSGAADVAVLEGPRDHALAADLQRRGVHVVLLSAWGRGAREEWPATAAVVAAAGGWSVQIGWPDGAPIAPPAEQAWELTAVAGAFAAVLADYGSGASGRSSPDVPPMREIAAVDVVAATTETAALAWIHDQRVNDRPGRDHPLVPHQLLPAADGWVATGLGGNPAMWQRLVEWFTSEGNDGLADERFGDPVDRVARRADIAAVIARFCAARPARQLGDEAQRRRVPWAAVLTPAEVLGSEQLAARQFFAPPVDGATTGSPRLPWITTTNPLVPAPTGDRSTLPPPEPAESAGRTTDSSAVAVAGDLEGVRVLDLTWVLAGPFATRLLADHGAEVIKVESRHRPDPTRFSPSMHLGAGRPPGHGETSGYFANHNRNKASIALNLRHADAMAVLRRLIAASDVVIDNFSAGQLARWALGPDELWELHSDLIVVEMSGMGQTGPWRDFVSYADAVSALSGLTGLTRDDSGEPVGVVFGLADLVAGYHGALATAAALVERRRTGAGQYVDLSQLEAMTFGLAAHLGDERDDAAATVVTTRGADGEWCVAQRSAASSDVDTADPLPPRADELAAAVRRLGVAASVASDGRALVETDRQHRDVPFYLDADHPVIGRHLVEGDPIIVGGQRPPIRRPAPLLGSDTDDVLASVAGYGAAEIAALRAAGVLE